jgi:peptidoglycan L-alanyl-D-glutamate endopeptidase CwlK
VHPALLTKVTALLQKFPMFVVSGVRSLAEQQALYAQGRTKPGKVVTNCDGVTSKSNHQVHTDGWGHAVDVAWIPTPARPDPFDAKWPWKEFGTYATGLGLVWGGSWHSIVDMPHVEQPDAPFSSNFPTVKHNA